jgi:penicillin amidase
MPAPAPRRDPTTDKTLAPLFAALDAALPAPPVATSASNAWAVAGGRTASGKPILANDPHLGLKTPNIWYLARIEAPGLTLAGATAPGVPFHVLGHNGRIAWGMTTTGADTQDLYIETVDPADPGRYLTPSGPRRFSTRQETITVAGAAPVTITVRETRHGPVISDVAGDTAALTAPGKVIALAATALRADDRTAEALYRINLARDWSAFIDALTRFDSPVQNFTYADVEGHIGFATAGRIPVRRAGDGRMPVPGASAAFDWIGMIPRRELPTVVDPPGGTLINANNRVVGPGYPWLLTMDWGPSHRASRIEAVITATNPHDSAAARALQGDVVSLVARELLPLMLRQTAAAPTTARARALLAAWDGTVGRERPEPLIFTAWLRALNRALFADELGPAFARYQGLRPSVIAGVLGSGGSWCDDITTSATETCPAMLARALSEALAELRTDHGDDPALWRWGTAHVAKFRNRALDWIPLIGRATRIPIATGGDDFTVNRGTTRIRSHIAPYAHVHGPTLRAIYDLADLDRSQFIQPGGQSGNPFSAHYRDLTTRWRDGKYLTLPASPAGKTRGLRLVPAQVP